MPLEGESHESPMHRIFAGIGRSVQTIPEAQEKWILGMYERHIYPKLTPGEQEIARKLKPSIIRGAQIAGWTLFGMEAVVTAITAKKGFDIIQKKYFPIKEREMPGKTPILEFLHECLDRIDRTAPNDTQSHNTWHPTPDTTVREIPARSSEGIVFNLAYQDPRTKERFNLSFQTKPTIGPPTPKYSVVLGLSRTIDTIEKKGWRSVKKPVTELIGRILYEPISDLWIREGNPDLDQIVRGLLDKALR